MADMGPGVPKLSGVMGWDRFNVAQVRGHAGDSGREAMPTTSSPWCLRALTGLLELNDRSPCFKLLSLSVADTDKPLLLELDSAGSCE